MPVPTRFTRFSVAGLLLCLVLCLAPPSGAQRFTINGRVLYDANGSPAMQVLVTLRNFTDMGVDQTATDSMGNFTFSVGRGVYYLSVRQPGYMEISERVEVGISSINGVQLSLRAMPAKAGLQTSHNSPRFTVPAELLKVPEKARESYRAGLREFNRNANLPSSMRFFQKAIDLYPEFAEAHYWKGMVQLDLTEYENARASFEESVRLNEKLAAAYFPLGSLHMHFREPEKAASILQKGLAQFDKYWQGHFELARACVAIGKLKEAEISARRAQQLKPDFHRVHVLLANIYWEQGRDAEALAEGEMFLKAAPEDPVAEEIRQRVQQIKATKPPGS